MEIFPDHAVYHGQVITLHEAAVILARAMGVMYKALTVEDGYTHYDLAMSLKYNVICTKVHDDKEENVA